MRQEACTRILGRRNENRNWNLPKRKKNFKEFDHDFRVPSETAKTRHLVRSQSFFWLRTHQNRPDHTIPVSLPTKNSNQPNARIRELKAPAAFLSTWTRFMNILLLFFTFVPWIKKNFDLITLFLYQAMNTDTDTDIYIYSLSKNINFKDFLHCYEIFCVVFTINRS
jgi:hypothetical protein